MTMRINAAQGTGFEAKVSSTEAPDQSVNINFQNYGPDENYLRAKETKEQVTAFIKANKDNMELVIPYLFDCDHIMIAGDGKMTYGELREILGIPPQILSETNNKKLKDTDIVENARVNLTDIGWYPLTPQDSTEAADYRAQREAGNHHAGYDRSLNNEDILKMFKE